jgi:hypothetical protein
VGASGVLFNPNEFSLNDVVKRNTPVLLQPIVLSGTPRELFHPVSLSLTYVFTSEYTDGRDRHNRQMFRGDLRVLIRYFGKRRPPAGSIMFHDVEREAKGVV